MRKAVLFILLFLGNAAIAQNHPIADTAMQEALLLSINRRLDSAVVAKDESFMSRYYADDFYFQHATGMVDTKKSWISRSMNAATVYQSRTHDSVQVELHDNIGIVAGTLRVRFPAGVKQAYAVRYIRVFAYRGDKWLLISHRSSAQWNLAN